MQEETSTTKKNPGKSTPSCMWIILPLFVLPSIILGLIRLSQGSIESGLLFIVVGLSLLVIIPAGYLARLIFRGKLGEFIRGEEIDHPVIQTRRLTISIREERRPWWILFPIFFILGWIFVYFIVTYVN